MSFMRGSTRASAIRRRTMVLKPFGAGAAAEVANYEISAKGRSLWADAARRFFRHTPSVVSLAVLVLVALFAFTGQYFAVWTNAEIDWSVLGKVRTAGMPSLETGHFFGTDDLGRDLYSRVVQGSQISLMVGIVGA